MSLDATDLYRQLQATSPEKAKETWAKVDSSLWHELVTEFLTADRDDSNQQVYGQFGIDLLRRGITLFRPGRSDEIDESAIKNLMQLYLDCPSHGEETFPAMLLHLLATSSQDNAWRAFTELLHEKPLTDSRAVVIAISPLFTPASSEMVGQLFPGLKEHLGSLPWAAAVLDLANFYTRHSSVSRHPLAEDAALLANMLGQFTQRVLKLEESPPKTQEDLVQRGQQVNDSVAVMIGLLDAVALIGDPQYVGKVYPLLEIAHRRLRVEAAAALAKLGEEAGEEALCKMAEETSVRLRVLVYAEELGIDEKIPEPFRTPVARAEAELVAWLTEPTQYAVPPDDIQLFDERTLYWPGHDERVTCFLFRYGYEREERFENIGIAGPCTSTVAADLLDLPPQQIYALFAGLTAEHEDIYQVAVDKPSVAAELARLERRIPPDEYEDITPLWIGVFFEYRALACDATRDGTPGTLIVDDQETVQWTPRGNSDRSLGANEAYAIYKGRRLLESFNDDFRS